MHKMSQYNIKYLGFQRVDSITQSSEVTHATIHQTHTQPTTANHSLGPSPSSSSGGPSYDLSMAALKLSLQPRPRTMFWRGRWKGRKSLPLLTSAMAVWRLSSELDFFRPSVGPSSTGAAGAAAAAAGAGKEAGWINSKSALTDSNSAFPQSTSVFGIKILDVLSCVQKKDHRFIKEADIDSDPELKKKK